MMIEVGFLSVWDMVLKCSNKAKQSKIKKGYLKYSTLAFNELKKTES